MNPSEIRTSEQLQAFIDSGASVGAILAVVDKLLDQPEWVVLDVSRLSFTLGYKPTHDSHTFTFPEPEPVQRRYGQRAGGQAPLAGGRRSRSAPAQNSDRTM